MSINPLVPAVVPMLAYENGPAAMDWLCSAFGFRERTRWLDEAGKLAHGELLTEYDGLVMLASPTPDYEGPRRHREHCESARRWSTVPWVINGVLVYVSDIQSHYDRASLAGAHILSQIENDFPGKRYRAEDCEGHRWMFMKKPVA
jgi:PhnB protein